MKKPSRISYLYKKNMLKRLLSLLFFTISFFQTFSQNEIKIELKDSETNQPVSYATVRFNGTNRGIIADYGGGIRIPFEVIDSIPNLLISSIGYKSINVSLKELDATVVNIIKMIPQVESLDVVILQTKNRNKVEGVKLEALIKKSKKMIAKDIVIKAIESIPKNLSDNSHSSIGYYRDYQIVNNEYFNLNEAILEQFDKGISTHKTLERYNQGAFYSFKKNTNFEVDTALVKAYNDASKFIENASIAAFGGNELTILNIHDPIRNYNRKSFSYVYQLNKDLVINHVFEKKDIQFVEGEPIINISFKTVKPKKRFNYIQDNAVSRMSALHNVDGLISISLLDFSIHDFSYTMYDSNPLNPLFNVKIEYRRQDGNMYLNYISFNNRFIIEAGNDVFREISAFYDKEINAFEVKFNNEIDKKSVKKKRFSVKYKGKRAFVKDVEFISSRVIRINIADFDDLLKDLQPKDMIDVDFKIRKVKDINGAKIYKKRRVVAYQFREFFVQEVFPNKELNKKQKFISKVRSLDKARINNEIDPNTYIINSPLEKRVMKLSDNEEKVVTEN